VEHLVIVRSDAPDHFTAQAIGFPEITGEAETEAAAIDEVRQSLTKWLEAARLVHVSIPGNGTGNPWLDSFGRSADDPEFPAYLEELRRARQADVVE
jgi:hypothetical protein